MSTETSLVLASDRLSQALSIEKGHMLATIKAQCFKGMSPDRISDTQLAAYIQVSQSLIAQAPLFNPLLSGFLYAYPTKSGGIEPIIGPDGIFALLASHKSVKGWKTRFDTIEGEIACTATIMHEKLGEITKTCFISEWVIETNPNWKTRPRHMLEIRTLKHAARQCIHGIPLDADEFALAEAHRGFENALPVTGTADPAAPPAASTRPPPPARRGSAKAAAAAAAIEAQTVSPVGGSPAKSEASSSAAVIPSPQPSEPPAASSLATGQAPLSQPTVIPPPAGEEPKKVEPAAPTTPEILPGINLDGFFGASWPLDLVIEIKEIKQLAITPAKTPVAVFTGHIEGQVEDQILQFVTIEGVGIDPATGKPRLVGDAIKTGNKITANVYSRLRAGRTDVAPVLWAAKISVTGEF